MPKSPESKDTPASSPDDWVNLHADTLFRHARSRVAGEHEARDLVQETLIAGWRARRDLPEGAPPGLPWLRTVLKNKIADHYRRVFRERGAGDPNAQLTPYEYDKVEHWDDAFSPRKWKEPSESDERGRLEIRETLDLCMAKLPVAHARAFMLREVESLGTEEIRQITGLSESNLFVMLHRARSALSRGLEENHFAKAGVSR